MAIPLFDFYKKICYNIYIKEKYRKDYYETIIVLLVNKKWI